MGSSVLGVTGVIGELDSGEKVCFSSRYENGVYRSPNRVEGTGTPCLSSGLTPAYRARYDRNQITNKRFSVVNSLLATKDAKSEKEIGAQVSPLMI